MNIVFSKRLAEIISPKVNLKINGENYEIEIRCKKLAEGELDYTSDIEVTEFNYFCYNKQNKITCWRLSKGDQSLSDSGKWKKEGREEIKPGKFMQLFYDKTVFFNGCSEEITDNNLKKKIFTRWCEIFTDRIKATNEDVKFEISENISSIYSMVTYPDAGYLNNSCMRPGSGHGCRHYSEFYDMIPGLRIVYRTIEEKLQFRALLWKIETMNGEKIDFLDCIYAKEPIIQKLIQYAKDNDWAWRDFNNDTIYYKDGMINGIVKISSDAIDYVRENGGPYIDTLFKLTLDGDNGILSNFGSYDYEFNSSEGTVISDLICDDCGEPVREGEAYFINGTPICENCFNNNYFCCERCGENQLLDHLCRCGDNYYCSDCASYYDYHLCEGCGEYHKDCFYMEGEGYFCESCFSDNFSYCEVCEEDHRNNEVQYITVNGEGKKICDDCRKDLYFCEECKEYFTNELTEKDGKFLCENCIEILIEK